MSTTGKSTIFSVWIRVNVSKISSIVPIPPGRATKRLSVVQPLRAGQCPLLRAGSPPPSSTLEAQVDQPAAERDAGRRRAAQRPVRKARQQALAEQPVAVRLGDGDRARAGKQDR